MSFLTAGLIVSGHPWNSDLLYLEALWREAKVQQPLWQGFHFSGSTFLFPDFPIWALIRSMLSNLNLALMAYLCVQFWMLWMLLGQLFTDLKGKYRFIFLVAFLAIFGEEWKILFFPVYHGGQWLLGTTLLFWYAQKRDQNFDIKRAIPFAMALGLLTSSDLLYAVNGIFPFGLAASIQWVLDRKAKPFFKQFGLCVLVFVFTLIFYFGVKAVLPSFFGWNKPYFSLEKAQNFFSYFYGMNVRGLMIYSTLIVLGWRFKKDLAARYFFVSVLWASLAIMLTGSWSELLNIRYFYPLPFAVCYAVITLFENQFRIIEVQKGIRTAIITALVIGLFFTGQTFFNEVKQSPVEPPTSSALRCFDAFVEKSGLQQGMGNYWAGKYLSYLSSRPVRVLEYEPNLNPFYWINSHTWFLDAHPRFAILHGTGSGLIGFNPNELKLQVQPTQKVTCGEFDIWVFSEDIR